MSFRSFRQSILVILVAVCAESIYALPALEEKAAVKEPAKAEKKEVTTHLRRAEEEEEEEHCEGGGHDCEDHDDHEEEKTEKDCFHGDDTVTLESGEALPLSELAVGDRVLAASADGRFSYSPVVFLPHGFNNKAATFVEVSLESGKRVSATPQHLLKSCDGTLSFASSLSAGSCLSTTDGEDLVKSTRTLLKHGVYTAVLAEEFLVVNGVVASPFAYVHSITNVYYSIHRALARVAPSLLKLPAAASINSILGSAAAAALAAFPIWSPKVSGDWAVPL